MSSKIVLTSIASHDHISIQLALYYLKAYFLKYKSPGSAASKIDIKILIFKAEEDWKRIAENIINERPNIAGFSCYVWNIKKILRVAKEIKKTRRSVKIILGGPEASPRAENILRKESCVDIIVRGEGEETFVELAESLLCGRRKLSQIKGISYREKGRTAVNPPRPQIDNLNNIPSPYLEGLVDLQYNYRDDSVVTETMRGCPYRCHYCYYHKEFKGIRYFSLRRVEKEFKWILKKRPAVVYLMDPTFNSDCKRAKEILRIWNKHNRESSLHLELKAEKIDEEMAELLKLARVSKLEIGIQSICPGALKLVNRDLDKLIFAKKARLLNRKKVPYEVQLIDALPGHDYDKIKQGVDWLISLRAPSIVIMRLQLLPGTYLRENADVFGIRYAKNPEYFWRDTIALSSDDANKIDRLREALDILYNRGYLRHTLFALKKRLGVNFCDIFEAWQDYGPHSKIAGDRTVGNPLGFIKYLCNRYKNLKILKKVCAVYLEKDFRFQPQPHPHGRRIK